MFKTIVDAVVGLIGGKGTTQVGKDNQAVSGISVGDNAGMVVTGNNVQVFQNAPPSPQIDEFEKLDGMMHDVFEKLRAGLKEHPDIREIVIFEGDTVYNAPRPGFVLRDKTFPTVHSLMDELESKGHIRDISKGTMKRYRMAETFAQNLLRSTVGDDIRSH